MERRGNSVNYRKKRRKRENVEDYREVTLMSSLYKVYTLILWEKGEYRGKKYHSTKPGRFQERDGQHLCVKLYNK